MKATLLLRERVYLGTAFVEMVIWRVPRHVPGSRHPFKYSLALVRDGVCLLRFDNEAGKGDHRHVGALEEPYDFSDIETLIRDFRAAIVGLLP